MARSTENASQPQAVLLVEDNPGDARLVKEVCNNLGFTDILYTVSSGSDALDFVNQRGDYSDAPRPDLILLDWHLSGMSGEEVLEELNSDPDHNHIPVIVTTGSLPKQEVRRVYEKNANACIEKPVDPDELEEIIRVIEAFWLSTARLPAINEEEQ